MPDPQDWLFPRPRPTGGPVQLPQTPLEETNPWLAKIRDFMGNLTGMGTDRGVLSDNPTGAGLVGDAAGMFNPEKMMMLPIAGMTRFLKGVPDIDTVSLGRGISKASEATGIRRVPDIAAREAATERAIQQMIDTAGGMRRNTSLQGVDQADLDKAIEIARKYPRTTAHIENMRTSRLDDPIAAVTQPKGNKFSDLKFDPDMYKHYMAGEGTLNRYGLSDEFGSARMPFADSFAHELQHVGQGVVDPNLLEKYSMANEAYGYRGNPYEIPAREGAIRRVYGVRPQSQK